MEDFLIKKEIYFERLHENPEVLQGILNDERNKGKPSLRVILDPATENELTFANLVFTYFSDVFNMAKANSFGVDRPNYDEDPFIDCMSRLMVALKNRDTDEIKRIGVELNKKQTPEFIADLIYGMMRTFTYSVDETLAVLADKSGFDMHDRMQSIQFTAYFQEANDTLNRLIDSPVTDNLSEGVDFENEEIIDFLVRFTNAFDEKYRRDFLRENTK